MHAPFSPGSSFRDPVLDPQRLFRTVLDAMSRPGLVRVLPETGVRGPDALQPHALAILLALCDHDTPVWLDSELRASSVGRWLSFHSGAPVTDDPGDATFGVFRPGVVAPDLAAFAQGDARYPDRSTTLLVLCDGFEGGDALTFEGPGIETAIACAPLGLPARFSAQAQDNHRLYPRGLDFLLLAGDRIVGLPRSTRITTEAR